MRTLVRLLVGAHFVILALIPGWVWLQSHDLKTVRDGDLQVKRYIAPPDHNGIEFLRNALDVLVLTDEESRLTAAISTDEEWDSDLVTELVQRDAQALEVIEEALRATYYVLPAATDLPQPEMVGWQKLAKLLVLRAALFAAEEDPWSAGADWQRVLTLGARIERARGGGLLTASVGLSIRELALDAIERHARGGLFPDAVGLELARALAAYRSDNESWSEIWRNEYQALKPALSADYESAAHALDVQVEPSSLLRRLVPSSFVFHPNRSREHVAEYFRSRSREAAMPCSAQTRPSVAPVDLEDPAALRQLLLEPNGLGRLVLQVGMDRYDRNEVDRCATDTRLAAVQAFLALRAYEVAEGSLPGSLSELVPDYLDAVPVDAFDGRALRFAPDRRIVYSVGVDLSDAGGQFDPEAAGLPGEASPDAASNLAGADWADLEPTLSLGPEPVEATPPTEPQRSAAIP